MITKSFDEVCKSVGYDRKEPCPIPFKNVYYAYINGSAEGFEHRADAEKVSKNIECVITNKAEREEWYASRRLLEQKAFESWYAELQEQWISPELPSALFEICYSEAYDRGHSAGYDEVANYLYSVVEFALRVKACN